MLLARDLTSCLCWRGYAGICQVLLALHIACICYVACGGVEHLYHEQGLLFVARRQPRNPVDEALDAALSYAYTQEIGDMS